ncbi:unnamed protein product [Diamesa tonsa]
MITKTHISLILDPPKIQSNQLLIFVGGNQRDLARAKNLKKNQDQQKRNDDGLTPGQRKERDAAALNEKISRKEEEKKAAASKKELYVTSIKIYSRRRLHIYNFLQYKLESMKRKAKKQFGNSKVVRTLLSEIVGW